METQERKKGEIMPVKTLICDYCRDEVSPNTIGMDINHPTVKITICAKCLKSVFDYVAGQRRRSKQ